MKKTLLLLLVLFTFVGMANAQKIKFKKGKVLVDGVECLNYDSSDPNQVMISTLDNSQTIFLKSIRTGVGQNDGLYSKVVFAEQKKSLTSRSYIFTRGILVKKLISNKVLDNCTIDPSKMDNFILRYDEQIEERLIRH